MPVVAEAEHILVVPQDLEVQVAAATAHLLQSDHPEQLILEEEVEVVHILVHIILAEQEVPVL
jgi:hypothetical protein